MEPLLNYAWIRWIISCSFSSTCPLPASSYFCFLLMFSLKKTKLYFLARIESSFDEVLYLAVVFIFSLSCLPLKRTKKRKKPWRTGTVATGSEWYRRPPLLNREGRGRARADRAPATETVKVPLGIMQVPDIRRVFKCRLPSGVLYWPLIPNMSPYFTYSTSITRESTSPSSSSGRRKMNEWRRKLCLLAPCESVASQASWKDLIRRLCDNILLWNNVWWLIIPVFRRVPLCHPLLTMRSVGAVVLALAAAALSSADSDTHRPRHDSNLEICILLLTACRAAAKCCPLMSLCVCASH